MSNEVLAFCPTYEVNGQDQVRPETIKSIEEMQGDFDFTLGKHNPYRHGHMNILHQYQMARKMALAGGYDYLLTIEHDMIIPRDAIPKMLATGEQVVYGLYMLRHGAQVLNAWRYVKASHVGMSLSLFPDQLRAARAQVVAEVSGVGMGCTMIGSGVLNRFDFHPSESSRGSQIPDVAFATDCLRAGIKQVCHFDVICGHITPEGEVLWPFGNGDRKMIKVKVIQSVNAPGGIELKEGETVEIPEEVAEELGRAGYVSLPPKVKPAPKKPAAKPVRKAASKKGE